MRSGGRRIRGSTASIVVLVAALLISAVAMSPDASAHASGHPTFTGVEFKEFHYARLPTLPGVSRLTSRPPIYDHAEADTRIQTIAEFRGYRLQAVPTVPLGSYGGLYLAADAGHAWMRLLDSARANGTPLQGNSGHRSVDDQRAIFRRELREEGEERIGRPYTTSEIANGRADDAIDEVLQLHSIPGYSRHHTAKTIDMSHRGGTNGTFANSAAYRWISANNYAVAKAHGFIPNYPPNAGPQGPRPEPWEFGWVGVDSIRCAERYVDLQDPDAALYCHGTTTPGIVREIGTGRLEWHVRNTANSGPAHTSFVYGLGTDTPVAGDWDRDGIATPGIVRDTDRGQLEWHLRNTIDSGPAHISFVYGRPTDTPIAGDWNHDGTTTPGIVRETDRGQLEWHLRNTIDSGPAHISFVYGRPTDTPIAGDWNHDGTTTPGVVRETDRGQLEWHLRNTIGSGPADTYFIYGRATDTPVTGDWNRDGAMTPGIVRETSRGQLEWHLRNTANGGSAHTYFIYGRSTDTPVAGDWDGV